MTKRVTIVDGTGKKPRQKKTTTVVTEVLPPGTEDDTGEVNDFDVTLEGVDDYEQLQDALQQFGYSEGVVYKIYRVTPTGQSFCYETTEYSETFLQRERGAGRYAVRLFVNAKYKKTIFVEVDAPASGTESAQNPSNSHSAFLEKLLMVLLTKDTPAPAAGPSIAELTTALTNLDALRGKQETGIDLFMKAFEMARTVQGDGASGDWKSELLRMGRDAIPAITSVVQARVNGTDPTKPPINGNQEPPMPIDPATMTEEQKKAMLKNAIAFLKPQCIQGLPPESALDFITANSGNPQYQTLIMSVLGYTFEDILEIDHEIKSEPFHLFFRTLYDGLRSEFGGDDPVGDDPGRDSGNTGDTRSNGSVGKAG